MMSFISKGMCLHTLCYVMLKDNLTGQGGLAKKKKKKERKHWVVTQEIGISALVYTN